MTDQYVVEMVDISKSFGGVVALDGVDLQLQRGEILGIVGDNGAGKSTLMKILSSLHLPDKGKIHIDGQLVAFAAPQDARASGVEMIYQDLALFDNLDITANVYIGRELSRSILGIPFLDKRRMHAEAQQLFERLNIGIESTEQLVSGLSGGQRQSVAVGRALSFNCKVLIMDEPTAALGPSESAMVADLIRQLRDEGIGIFLVSHDMHDVFDLCDRVIVMNRGEQVGAHGIEEVTKDDILSLIIKGELPMDWAPRNQGQLQ